ncbi:MAG: phosphopentomutase [Clostridia bacterium]
MKKRAILIVLDSVGIGALPDAGEFGDEGAHTLGNIYKAGVGLELPNMYRLGLSHITDSCLPEYTGILNGSFGRAAEVTKAKDTTCGHWEMTGIIMDKPFRTYPNGFPDELISEYERRIGRKVLGNCVASGTQIIQQLGDEHVKTGKPIVYTSADSVFQVAAHEQVIPIEELYRICTVARELLMGENLVGRIIARPFTGKSGSYTRTENRRDYAVEPVRDTIMDGLQRLGHTTVGIGKIEDIFCKRGIDIVDHTKNNRDGFAATMKYIKECSDCDFIFANLVDFDMLFGHRNDVGGYADALMRFDTLLPELMDAMQPDDMLIITADHGCDPTFPGTNHTREYIPVLVYGKNLKANVDIGTRSSFSDIGCTVFEYLTGTPWHVGISFLSQLKKD